jgi:hypothetical protein
LICWTIFSICPLGLINNSKGSSIFVCLPQIARPLLNDALQAVDLALQRDPLRLLPAAHLAHLNCPDQRRDEVIPVDWLLDEVEGPAAEGLHHQVLLGVPGDHQRGYVGPMRPDLAQKLETVHTWHLDVSYDRVVIPGGDPLKCGSRRVSRVNHHAVHSESQGLGKRAQQGRVVIDNEHASLDHGFPLRRFG